MVESARRLQAAAWPEWLVTLVALAALLPFGLIVIDLVAGGLSHVSWAFLTSAPARSGRAGGILPIIVSTLLILLVALGAVFPVGLATAVLLCEVGRRHGRLGRWVGLSLNILAGVPSIVFGLFGSAFFCIFLGMGFSILAGGLTLACMALPLFVRTAQAGLSAVPEDWRRGAVALGLSAPSVLASILLPGARRAIAVGLVLTTGRALAETAALIFTSGYVDRMPSSLHDSGRALSVHIFDLSMNVSGGERNAYASAVVLMLLIGAVNLLVYALTEGFLRKGMME